MLAMYYTLKATNLDSDEICVFAQHVQGVFGSQLNHQHHQYYHHHNHHHHYHQQATNTSTAINGEQNNHTVIGSASNSSVNNTTIPDPYTLQLLWLIGSGAPFKQCYLDSSECILWPKQDTKLLKLLIDSGVRLSEKIDEDDDSKNILVSSSQVI